MGSHGIKDQVAIIGMGCTPFTEHWDKSLDDLIIDAAGATYASAGVSQDDVDAFWFGTSQSAASGLAMAGPLKIHGKPVSRVENYCATGSEAMRQAAYAVASGAYDVVMALGAEKVKDGGYQGLNAFPIPTDGTQRTLTAAAMFSLILPAYSQRYGVDEDQLRYVVAKIAEKNHYNGARNELAQFRRETSAEKICEMAAVAGKLSVFDCAGVADGARRRDHVPPRGRSEVLRQPALHQSPVVRGRHRRRLARPRLRLHDAVGVEVGGRRRLRPGRCHRSQG